MKCVSESFPVRVSSEGISYFTDISFYFFFFLPKFLVCSSLRRLILAGKVNLYKVNEGYVIETISFFPVFLGTIQYSYNWNKQSICLFSFNYIHIVCQRLKLIYCVCCIEPIRIPR